MGVLGIILALCSCDMAGDAFAKIMKPSVEEAEKVFIKKNEIITSKEALAEELSYYKSPAITERCFSRYLTGRDVIHEMNILLKEEASNSIVWKYTNSIHNPDLLNRAKSRGVDHPDDIIAAEYYFSGTFTSNRGYEKYVDMRCRLIYMFKPVDIWFNIPLSRESDAERQMKADQEWLNNYLKNYYN